MRRFDPCLIAACLVLVVGCESKSSSDAKGEPQVDATDGSTTDTNTGSGSGTGSGTGTGTGSGTGSGGGSGTGSGSGNEEDEPQNLVMAGVVSFSATADEADFTHDQLIEDATVFLKGFPDQTFKTDSVGAFTVNLDLNASRGLTGTDDDFKVIVWKVVGAVKYGKMVDAVDVPLNQSFDLGEIKLAYTKKYKFQPKEAGTSNLIDVTAANCSANLLGFEGKAAAVLAGGELALDYLPEGTYGFHLKCDGYEPKDDNFIADFDADQNPTWEWLEVDLTPITP